MTDPKKKADRWKAKYNLKRVNETLTDLREDMAARYEAAIAQVYAMETKVKRGHQRLRCLDLAVRPLPQFRQAALQAQPGAELLG